MTEQPNNEAMRGVKFRGKDLRTGKWLCGSLMQWKDRCFIIPFDSAPGTGWIEVDPETTGEFTSQLDKNGKDVYEHDRAIVRDNRGNTFTARIEWGNRGFVQIEEEGNGGEYTYTDWFFEIEVIGNIHDNPSSVSMKSPDIKTPDSWCCGNCGSPDVLQQAWVDPNTGEVISNNDCDRGDYWCENCEDHHYPVRESELLRNADEWWSRSDFRQMERVTGYRQLDYDPEDDCQAFVDACDGWWNGKTAGEKIGVWLYLLSGNGEMSDTYALVEFPENGSHFENEGIGYSCFRSEDNGARYVPEQDYIAHFRRNPARDKLFKPLRWPESQNWLHRPDNRCEVIMADEKALAEFGSAAVWVPVEVLESAEPKYARVLDEVRNLFTAEIAEADANPDKWYEVFVADRNGETHSESSGDTFEEAVRNFESIADEWGIDHTSIDIWKNRENPSITLQIK